MDAAISSSVTSTLKLSLSAPTTLQSTHHNFKTPNLHPRNHNNRSSRRNSITTSSRRNSFTHTTSRSDPSPSTFHKRASTGYAAALLDIAQCSNALPRVESDVRRFSRLLRKVLEHPETNNERVVKEVVEAGRFHKTLVGLVNMLLNKGLDMVVEVMEEFQRIYDQLAGTTKAEDELFGIGIARRLQMISGPAQVKVNNLVAPHPSSFAH